jgi:hypothetical protein
MKTVVISKRCRDIIELNNAITFLKDLLPEVNIKYSIERVYLGDASDSRTPPIHVNFIVEDDFDLSEFKIFVSTNQWKLNIY